MMSVSHSRFRSAKTFAALVVCVAFNSVQSARALDGPLTPEQAIASFKIEPGLRVELVVAEPDVVDPVALCFDEKGRMYVAEDRGYPVGPGKGKPPEGQIVLLESTKGDGHYDKRTVFADKLTFPNGVMPWRGGLFVTCAPYLYYFKDTNSDGIADVKKTIYKGFQDLSTTQLRVSHPTLNIDNWVYLTSGLTAAKIKWGEFPDRPEVFANRTDVRFNPLNWDVETTAGTAQFGQSFDAFGRKFICSNRNHNQHVVMQLKYQHRNPHLDFGDVVQDIPDHGAASRVYPLSHNITTAAFHAGYFTSACGVTVYNGTELPEKYRGNSFTCEPAGNLVHHDVLSASNATFVASREFDKMEFIASPDNWFRPVNLAHGPDGALYLCDMYRKTIEHPEYLPDAMKPITDFTSGKDKGRIYRIVAADAKPTTKKFDLTKASPRELCALLENPNVWWRMTAQRLLLERQDRKAGPILKHMVKSGRTPEARAFALRLLEGLNLLEEKTILLALDDKDPNVREHGILTAEPRLQKSPALLAKLISMANDENGRVRFQCALSLGEVDDVKIIPALATIVQKNLDDKWTRAAVMTSVHNHSDLLLEKLLAGGTPPPEARAMLVSVCRQMGATDDYDKLSELLQKMILSGRDSDLSWQIPCVTGLAEGLRSRSSNLSSIIPPEKPAVSKALHEHLDAIFQHSSQTALDPKLPIAQRAVAVGLLSHAPAETATPTLQKLLDPQQSTELQTAAVRALSQLGDLAALSTLLEKQHWSSFTPTVRDAVMTIVMGQPPLIEALLTHVEQNEIPAWTIGGEKRGQLMKSKDEAIKARATKLFKEMIGGNRMKVYEEYKGMLSLKGDAKNGHTLFTKTCAPCHVVSGEGNLVGPDLTGIRNQPKEVLLLHIIVPEYEIMPTYTLYNAETKDGESYSGLLAADTAESITLRQAQGVEQKVPRAKLTSLTTSSLSLMPQELEKTMTKQELADVLAFLKGE